MQSPLRVAVAAIGLLGLLGAYEVIRGTGDRVKIEVLNKQLEAAKQDVLKRKSAVKDQDALDSRAVAELAAKAAIHELAKQPKQLNSPPARSAEYSGSVLDSIVLHCDNPALWCPDAFKRRWLMPLFPPLVEPGDMPAVPREWNSDIVDVPHAHDAPPRDASFKRQLSDPVRRSELKQFPREGELAMSKARQGSPYLSNRGWVYETDETTMSQCKATAAKLLLLATQDVKKQEEDLERQLRAMMRGNNDIPDIWTCVDKAYGMMLLEADQMAKRFGFGGMMFVAMDENTLINACALNLPYVFIPFWTKTDVLLKQRVAHSKFVVAAILAKIKRKFFFTEMDIWFLHSPLSVLPQYPNAEVIFPVHHDNPASINIGFYYIKPSNLVEKLFRKAAEVCLKEPKLWDAVVLGCVMFGRADQDCTKAGPNKDIVVPTLPEDQLPKYQMLDPHVLVSHIKPFVMSRTIGVHVLTNAPLKNAACKVWMAKSMLLFNGAGSYYDPAPGERFLVHDGPVSMAVGFGGGYHQLHAVFWRFAFLIATAYRLNRTLVMPTAHNGEQHHLWPELLVDQTVVGKWVRWRESTYLSNPRLKRSYFKKAVRAAMAIEKGTHGFRGDGSRAFDIGHHNFAWRQQPVLAMETLNSDLASTRFGTDEIVLPPGRKYWRWSKPDGNKKLVDALAFWKAIEANNDANDAELLLVQVDQTEIVEFVREATVAEATPSWLVPLLQDLRFCEGGAMRHPNVPESSWGCESVDQKMLNLGVGWTGRHDHLLRVEFKGQDDFWKDTLNPGG